MPADAPGARTWSGRGARLDELRDDPRVRAKRILDDREVPRRSGDREVIVGLWERLASMGEATTEDLDNSLR